MTRKEFILSLFQVVKLLVLITLFFYLFFFIRNAIFIEDSVEENILIIISIAIGILIILGLVRLIFEKTWNSFSEKTKTFLITFNKIMEFVSLFFFIWLAYVNWKSNKMAIIIFGIILFFTYTNKFLKQTKQIE